MFNQRYASSILTLLNEATTKGLVSVCMSSAMHRSDHAIAIFARSRCLVLRPQA
jgi:hypothetical protein